MGSPDPRSFSRNKRGIAGSIIWSNFDRHALLDLVYKMGGEFIANVDDLRPQFMTNNNAFLSQSAIYQGSLVRDSGQSSGATIDQFTGQQMTAVSGIKEEASPWYSDQILPFDLTLAGTNEQGASLSPKSPVKGCFHCFYSVLRGGQKNLTSRGRSSRVEPWLSGQTVKWGFSSVLSLMTTVCPYAELEPALCSGGLDRLLPCAAGRYCLE